MFKVFKIINFIMFLFETYYLTILLRKFYGVFSLINFSVIWFLLFYISMVSQFCEKNPYQAQKKRIAPRPKPADKRIVSKSKLKSRSVKKKSESKVVAINLTGIAKEGQKLFIKEGCQACHFQKTGMSVSPYPSKPHMASLEYAVFEDCILKGRSGTAMVPQNLSKEKIKKIREYIITYKGK